jgi:hypothetical protein
MVCLYVNSSYFSDHSIYVSNADAIQLEQCNAYRLKICIVFAAWTNFEHTWYVFLICQWCINLVQHKINALELEGNAPIML